MADYTRAEYTDMVLVYGEAGYNANVARQIYEQRFPHRRIPQQRIFPRVVQRLRDEGQLDIRRVNAGRPRTLRTVRMEEEVLAFIEKNPEASTIEIARQMDTDHGTIWRILNNEQLHPYHFTRVQQLNPDDFGPRVDFCRWFLQQCQDEPNFQRSVLFTDEATFTRQGYWNSRNSHVWSVMNPHAIHCRGFQERFSVNIWAGIIDEHLIGPYLLPYNLNGPVYLQFLRRVLPELLEDVPLIIRQNMWLQHDGAPPHFSIGVRAHLNNIFEGQWIGRGGLIGWPARSPDLTPLDFSLWGTLKAKVYKTPVNSAEDLVARIIVAADEFRDIGNIFEKIRRDMLRRCNACIDVGGEQFEHLLYLY